MQCNRVRRLTIDPAKVSQLLLALGAIETSLCVEHDAWHPRDGLHKQQTAACSAHATWRCFRLVARRTQRRLAQPLGQLLQLLLSRCRSRCLFRIRRMWRNDCHGLRLHGRSGPRTMLQHVGFAGEDTATASAPKDNRFGHLACYVRISTHHIVERLWQDLRLAHLFASETQAMHLVALVARIDLVAHATEELQLCHKPSIGLDEAPLGPHQLVGGMIVQTVALHDVCNHGG